MQNRIAIVGAGYSGTILAAKLLRHPPPGVTRIVLVERDAAMGRGMAYAVRDCPYLLNVPAGRLSADAQDALQFLRFAQRTRPHAGAEDFLPRQMYGDYLEDVLSQAEHDAVDVTLQRVCGEVLRLTLGEDDEPLTLSLAGGDSLHVQRAVLALGNPPPQTLPWARALQNHPAYFDDPWTLPANLDSTHSVLIVGNGLTMVDVAFSLSRDPARIPRLQTISRRGLIPLTQSTFHASAVRGDGAVLLACAASMRRVVAASRALARDVIELGGDWREVVTFIRNVAPGLWQRLPHSERRRFIRHAQAFWDVHRHRLPPPLAEHLERLRTSGQLDVNAGRIERVEPTGDRLSVTWRRRGASRTESFVVDAIVNATGPDYSLKRSRNRLLQSLRRDGLVSEDELELGLRTTPQRACIGADGGSSERLFYIGPMLRADHWEATAATELRNHADELVRHLARAAAPSA